MALRQDLGLQAVLAVVVVVQQIAQTQIKVAQELLHKVMQVVMEQFFLLERGIQVAVVVAQVELELQVIIAQ